MEDTKIKLTIRQNSGSQFEVEINSKATVKDLKEQCSEKASIPAEEQRLIFKGKNRSKIIMMEFRKDLER